MKKLIIDVLVVLVAVAITFLVGWALLSGLDRDIKLQCQKLLSQSREYPSFYLTQGEKEMCDEIGVKINARVGNSNVQK